MAEKLTEENRTQAMKILENSYDMYQTTRDETVKTRKNKKDKDGNRIYSDKSLDETIELMDVMQADVVAEYTKLGGNPEDLKNRKVKKRNDSAIKGVVEMENQKDGIAEFRKNMMEEAKIRERNKYDTSAKEEEKQDKKADDFPVMSYPFPEPLRQNEAKNDALQYTADDLKYATPDDFKIDSVPSASDGSKKQGVNYDEVSLPSRGECYKSKKDRIKVSHLVAYDENLILSPGLYRNGTFLDHILKNKILDDIDPDSLIQGDRDAIIIWLRAGGYGPMYPIRMTDEETGTEFETEVDLSALNFREFKLKGDENGFFDFKLPNSGDVVKFRFLTAGDAKRLEKMHKDEDESENATDMRDKIRDVRDFIEKSDKFSQKEKDNISADLSDLDEIVFNRFKNVGETYFTHDLTNRLIMSTVSVNGISDRNYVMNYIMNMNLKDASEYRKYIINNEPGIDYNIKVKRPDSLGGGYVDTFLQLDQFIFVY